MSFFSTITLPRTLPSRTSCLRLCPPTDLGFFASIQSLQYKSVSRTVDDIIEATLSAFECLGVEKLENVFLTFQAVMRLVIQHSGDNQFRLPHLGKDALRRAGALMENVSCPVALLA
ncbi:hypothetical protein H310_14274 [Aphanomyces invadans]|uniref:Uncharacterized protein n=1 Tax=Aphanomyces invadans TaxID=157072 RepID=A0A024TAL1_9STRA|nr:hypothetical protein H310_14274 [Aphanomyces invadans]ETV91034.1 hypothetical protein H310_14274 [Aphanomyces invadans]|eukprot:XP_008880314.1 hypothetical protein H310_14274 [Aphanomyces invadans]